MVDKSLLLSVVLSALFIKLTFVFGTTTLSSAFEIITLDSFGYIILGQLILQFKLKDYVFEYDTPSETVLTKAKWVALYTLLDYMSLANLSFWTYCAFKFIMMVSLRFNEENEGQLVLDWTNNKALFPVLLFSIVLDIGMHAILPNSEVLSGLAL